MTSSEYDRAKLHTLPPELILRDMACTTTAVKVEMAGVRFVVLPDVFPSHRFRSTALLIESLKDYASEKTVIDMGCGSGIVGLCAMSFGAKRAILADVSKPAVHNACLNRSILGYSADAVEVYESDCFESVPVVEADIIVFNPPFHSAVAPATSHPLEKALYDPSFRTLSHFLTNARRYGRPQSRILIAFSNKGDIEGIERLFDDHGYPWLLWRIANQRQRYDTRLYQLTI